MITAKQLKDLTSDELCQTIELCISELPLMCNESERVYIKRLVEYLVDKL